VRGEYGVRSLAGGKSSLVKGSPCFDAKKLA